MASPAKKAGQAFQDFVFEISVNFFSVQYADSQYVLLLVLALASSTFCQSNPPILTARIIEVIFSPGKPRIIVAYGIPEREIIPINEYGSIQDHKYKPETIDSIMLENQKLTNTFYQEINDKGYEIQEMEMSVNNVQYIYIIFRRRA